MATNATRRRARKAAEKAARFGMTADERTRRELDRQLIGLMRGTGFGSVRAGRSSKDRTRANPKPKGERERRYERAAARKAA